MRLLHAIASLDLRKGGPPRSTYSLCYALAQEGAQVTLLTRSAAGWSVDSLARRRVGEGSFQVIVTPGIRYLLAARRLLADVDLVELQSVWKVSHAIIAYLCRRRGCPYVLTPRGELDVWSLQQKRIKKAAFMALVGHRMIDGAAAMHLLNANEENAFKKLALHPRAFVVPNGVAPAEWSVQPTAKSIRELYPQIGARTIVLFFARLHQKKGGVLLAKAFAEVAPVFPESFLVIAGPDYGERSAIEDVLLQRDLQDRSLLLDEQSGEMRLRIMMDADIVALPSVQEGHPRVVLEAGCLGKALLLTRECHVPELTERGAAEVVEPSVESIVNGLRRLLADEKRRRRIGRNAATEIRNNYTWTAIARRQLAILETLVRKETKRAER